MALSGQKVWFHLGDPVSPKLPARMLFSRSPAKIKSWLNPHPHPHTTRTRSCLIRSDDFRTVATPWPGRRGVEVMLFPAWTEW